MLGTAVGAPLAPETADREAIGGAVASNARMVVASTWARHVDVFGIDGLSGLSHLRTVELGLPTGSHLAWHDGLCIAEHESGCARSGHLAIPAVRRVP
jgi:hypothetical protein